MKRNWSYDSVKNMKREGKKRRFQPSLLQHSIHHLLLPQLHGLQMLPWSHQETVQVVDSDTQGKANKSAKLSLEGLMHANQHPSI
jgi:hypothetical protein